jgi:hypothetical protein
LQLDFDLSTRVLIIVWDLQPRNTIILYKKRNALWL